MIATETSSALEFKQVVIASDFGDEANRALAYAKSIMRSSQGELLLVHVGTPVAHVAIPEGGWIDDPERPHRECEETLALRQALRAEGLRVSSLCPFGDVEQEVAEAAKNHAADLVIVGTHARYGLDRLMFGSHAEKLARTLRVPLLIVGPLSPSTPAAMWAPRQLLCVVAPDEQGFQLVSFTSAVARAKSGHFEVAFRAKENAGIDERDKWVTLMQREIDKAEGDRRRTIQVIPAEADEAKKVVEMARRDQADLILIGGRHKLIALGSLFGRGTLPHLLAQAPCPVLVFPS